MDCSEIVGARRPFKCEDFQRLRVSKIVVNWKLQQFFDEKRVILEHV